MRALRALAATLLLLWSAEVGFAEPSARPVLEGEWSGSGMSLSIDAARAQARVDATKPFQWESFDVLNVAGPMVVFSVGARLFIAYLDGDRMTLTSRGHAGEWTLHRRPPR